MATYFRFNSDAFSEALVTNKFENNISIVEDIKEKGGFLYLPSGEPYLSQTGLQGLVLSVIFKLSGVPKAKFIVLGKILVSLSFAITLTVFFSTTSREFGVGAVIPMFVLMVSSWWIIALGTNLYWVVFVDFLPMVISWSIYPYVKEGKLKFAHFVLIMSSVIFLKSLSGYDYITNIILGPTVAILYYEVLRRTNSGLISKRVFATVFGGLLGLFTGLLLHFVQASVYSGSLAGGSAAVLGRAVVRIYGSTCDGSSVPMVFLRYGLMPIYPGITGLPLKVLLPVDDVVWHALGILEREAFMFQRFGVLGVLYMILVPRILWLYPAYGLCLFVVFNTRFRGVVWHCQEKLAAIAIATGWAMLCTWSWAFLAPNHMSCHYHVNTIIFYLPFGATLFMLIGGLGRAWAVQSPAPEFRPN